MRMLTNNNAYPRPFATRRLSSSSLDRSLAPPLSSSSSPPFSFSPFTHSSSLLLPTRSHQSAPAMRFPLCSLLLPSSPSQCTLLSLSPPPLCWLCCCSISLFLSLSCSSSCCCSLLAVGALGKANRPSSSADVRVQHQSSCTRPAILTGRC